MSAYRHPFYMSGMNERGKVFNMYESSKYARHREKQALLQKQQRFCTIKTLICHFGADFSRFYNSVERAAQSLGCITLLFVKAKQKGRSRLKIQLRSLRHDALRNRKKASQGSKAVWQEVFIVFLWF